MCVATVMYSVSEAAHKIKLHATTAGAAQGKGRVVQVQPALRDGMHSYVTTKHPCTREHVRVKAQAQTTKQESKKANKTDKQSKQSNAKEREEQ
eukprot:3627068-Pleurochrysis_carterae.AAC.1